jgi:hypothetical protein
MEAKNYDYSETRLDICAANRITKSRGLERLGKKASLSGWLGKFTIDMNNQIQNSSVYGLWR